LMWLYDGNIRMSTVLKFKLHLYGLIGLQLNVMKESMDIRR
jgi:hypothetical protein